MGSTSKLLVDAGYLGLGCETLGLGSWMPGVWRGAWAGGRQLGVGGGETGSGGRGGGVRVSHKLGRGLYLVGTAAFHGRDLRTHMFPVINSHICVHMHRGCMSMDGRDWGLRTFRSGAPTPSPGLLACPFFCEISPTLLLGSGPPPPSIPCSFSRFWGLRFLWPALL